MANNAVRSPGSRLSDDLYRLYLASVGWLLIPVYGEGFAAVLPTSEATMRWVFPIGAICVQLGWLWSGFRGGPLMVSRSSIVHELGAPISARAVLGPQLLRQSVAWGTGGAVAGGVLTSLGGDYSFSSAFSVSIACFLLLFSAVAWACTFMIGVRTTKTERTLYVAGAIIAAVAVTITMTLVDTIDSGIALIALLVTAVVGGMTAWHALDRIPVQSVWERARNLESARSAMLEVDLHRMMIDLRGAGDNKPAGATRLPTGRWLSLWRGLAPMRHSMPWSALRLTVSLLASALILAFAPIDQGVVLLGFGAVWLVIGYELTRGLAAITDHVSFFVHYPRSSFPLLRGQLVVSLGLGAVAIGLTCGWLFAVDQTEAIVAVVVSAMGVVAGAMQARLGSPDTTVFIAKLGLENAAALLWVRAAAAPLAVVAAIVLVFHGFTLQPIDTGIDANLGAAIAASARSLIPLLFIVSLAVSIRPLKKVVR